MAKSVGSASPSQTQTPLDRYRRRRDFNVTPEPAAGLESGLNTGATQRFVVQKHWARRLHYDFRLELDNVLVSWAVPKGPSFDPSEKRMAVHVEDHPLAYADFEGQIPPGQYGAGSVIVWDRGTWTAVGDPRAGLETGKLVFALHGEKLAGLWELVRISKPGAKSDEWMLFKKRDKWARPATEFDVVTALPDSVVAKPLGPLDPPALTLAPAGGDVPSVDDAPRFRTPASLVPQRAMATPTVPSGDGWIIETKFDGYRMLARIINAKVAMITGGGHDWTSQLRSLSAEIEKLDVSEGWIDGEIVVLRDGLPDFNALQNAIAGERNDAIVYFAFDLPFWEGYDLRQVPLIRRRAQLEHLVQGRSARVRFSEAFDAPPSQVFLAACKLGLEGLMFKRADSPYTSTRSPTWLKAKCRLRQEFVICGFADRAGAVGEVGKLLLGVYEEGELRYVGSVGTGWDSKTAADLRLRLERLRTEARPFAGGPRGPGRAHAPRSSAVHWVTPSLVAEVAFGEWTPAGHVRHASFKGMRSDKPATEIRREAVTAASIRGPVSIAVTNPERVVDPATGITKVELVRYYESVADAMLPHLKNRPVALVRAPDGIEAAMFFQKHAESAMPGLTVLDPGKWPGHGALLTVDSVDAIVAAAQMNVIEFHTWNSTASRIQAPDRVIFDLDPGEGVAWEQVKEAALLVQTLLDELGLKAWLKTSGGKGLHVVVPLAPRRPFEEVKAFSRSAVRHLATTIPQRFVAKSGPANRKGRIFVDYLRNGLGQTTVAAFSARARPGLGVSMPVHWEELPKLKSAAQWTVRDAREHLSFRITDPWRDYWSTRQSLTEALKRLS